jgi:serine protease Do
MILALAAALAAKAENSISSSRRTAIVTAIQKAAPAVVTINVVQIQSQRHVDPFLRDFFGIFDTPNQDRTVESLGSGFVFDAEGHILTNYHVLQDADAIRSVTLPDGRDLDVKFIGADERTDIAVLQATGAADLPHATLGDSDDLMIGEWVVAIGNPFGNMMRDPQPSVSVGVVSANHRRVSRDVGGGERLYQDLIQTDAAINPGNSGGPLVNADGQVVGVNTMIFSSSGGYQGLGFAIPVSRVKRVAAEIIQYGHRRDPWMGFHGEAVQELTPYSLQQLGVSARTGVLVTDMLKDCPAYQAGLRLGDVIIKVNGQEVDEPVDVDFVNWGLFVGDDVTLEVDRQGKALTFHFKIAELNAH